MKKTIGRLIFIVLIAATLLVSCGKKDKDVMEVSSIATDDNVADNSFSDLKDIGDLAGITNTVKDYDKSKDTCIKVNVVSYDSLAKKIKLFVDFGLTDCTCNDTKKRRGKINIEYVGKVGLEGSEAIYEPENYFINGYGVSGKKTIKIIEKFTHSIQVENGKVTKPDGSSITWISNRIRKMVSGYDTPLNFLDDSYEISGNSSGENSEGKSYSFMTESPLVKSIGCQWIKSGKLTIKREGKRDAIIDYGDGTCDDKAILSIGSWNKEISIKK